MSSPTVKPLASTPSSTPHPAAILQSLSDQCAEHTRERPVEPLVVLSVYCLFQASRIAQLLHYWVIMGDYYHGERNERIHWKQSSIHGLERVPLLSQDEQLDDDEEVMEEGTVVSTVGAKLQT
eukprot:Skav221720  [mRNA]  locus=scaffold542:245851:246219:- [translate_table: standard]